MPIGAFAYSQGLEAAVEAGFVSDEKGLLAWMRGLLGHAFGRLDLPALLNAHGAFVRGAPAPALAQLGAMVLAMRGSAELQAEDRRLGQALARVLDGWGVDEAASWMTAPHASYPVVFALGAARAGAPAVDAALAFGFAWAEAQVAAALRLLPLGQTAGQRVLSEVLCALPAAVARAETSADEPARWGTSSATLALLSARHETQYSRLFRS